MAKRFECPRCGAGVRPDDLQCGRCGEVLGDKSTVDSAAHLPSTIVVDKVISEEQTSIHLGQSDYLSLSRQKKLLEDQEKELAKRSKALAEREASLLQTMQTLERDNQTLKEAVKRFEAEDAELREREKALKKRERQLEALTEKLESELKRAKEHEEVSGGPIPTEELKRLLALRDDYEDTLRKDREWFRKQIEGELEERLERIKQMEQQLKVAQESLGERLREEAPPAKLPEPVEEKGMDEATVRRLLRDLDAEVKSLPPVAPKKRQAKVRTGIAKLDTILDGGIPCRHIVLVSGVAGTMKSSLAYSILHTNAKEGVRGMYFSLEQSRESIIRQMERLGMPREESRESMIVVDMVDLRKSMKDATGDWRSILMRYVKNVHEERKFDLFVLDSLESLKALTEFQMERSDVKDLFEWLGSLGLTTFIISEKNINAMLDDVDDELYLADGALELKMRELDHGRIQRWIRCMKMRGANVDTRYYSLSHENGRFNLSIPLVGSS